MGSFPLCAGLGWFELARRALGRRLLYPCIGITPFLLTCFFRVHRARIKFFAKNQRFRSFFEDLFSNYLKKKLCYPKLFLSFLIWSSKLLRHFRHFSSQGSAVFEQIQRAYHGDPQDHEPALMREN